MPFLRFTRDRRGYENTFLVDTVRRRGRERARVLYWFRSPPQVKIGRSAIDEAAIRLLEEEYPDVAFDWTRILEARMPEPEAEDPRRMRPRGRGDRDRDREREGTRRDARPEPRPEPSPEPVAAVTSPAPPEPPQAAATAADQADLPTAPDEPEKQAAEQLAAGDMSEAPAVEGHAGEPSAAARALGAEGLLRLRARYAEVCARISSQVADPARIESLRGMAERLNPDAWVTDEDVRAGLEQFEQVLDGIRREVGPIRRRTRRGGRRNRRRQEDGGAPHPSGGAAGSTPPQPDHPEDDEA